MPDEQVDQVLCAAEIAIEGGRTVWNAASDASAIAPLRTSHRDRYYGRCSHEADDLRRARIKAGEVLAEAPAYWLPDPRRVCCTTDKAAWKWSLTAVIVRLLLIVLCALLLSIGLATESLAASATAFMPLPMVLALINLQKAFNIIARARCKYVHAELVRHYLRHQDALPSPRVLATAKRRAKKVYTRELFRCPCSHRNALGYLRLMLYNGVIAVPVAIFLLAARVALGNVVSIVQVFGGEHFGTALVYLMLGTVIAAGWRWLLRRTVRAAIAEEESANWDEELIGQVAEEHFPSMCEICERQRPICLGSTRDDRLWFDRTTQEYFFESDPTRRLPWAAHNA